MQKIILASTSPRRKELLEKLNITFEVVWSDYEEDMDIKLEPLKLAEYLSEWKAKSVAKNYKEHIIIAADTFIELGGEILGKPHTPNEAEKMLTKISGTSLSVITGFTVIDSTTNKTISQAVETKVSIKKLSQNEIQNYIATGEPLDKAWAFAIQWLWSIIVERIEGDYFNVVGLPLNELSKTLKNFNIHIL